jgi:glycosyltransferase involved in cell wall biosynthesis
MVSVVTAVYNGEEFIADCIESVIAQTYSDWEYIIVDDGSTDGTERIVAGYLSDKRILYIKQENSGCSNARNRGIASAKGDYIAVLDADDLFYPQKLEKQVEYMKSAPACIALGSNADVIDAKGNIIFTSRQLQYDKQIKENLPVSPFYNSSILFRRTIFAKYKYEEKLKNAAEDGYLINQIADEGEFYNLPDVLIKYRINPKSNGVRTKREGNTILSSFKKLKINKHLTDEEINELNKLRRKPGKRIRLEYHSHLCYLYFAYNDKINREKFRCLIKEAVSNCPINIRNYYYCLIFLLNDRMLKRYYKKEWA